MTSFRSKVNQFVMNSALVISGVAAAVLPVAPASASDYYGANNVQPPAPVNFQNQRTYAPVGRRAEPRNMRQNYRSSRQEVCYIQEPDGYRTYVPCPPSFIDEYAHLVRGRASITMHRGGGVRTYHSGKIRWSKGYQKH